MKTCPLSSSLMFVPWCYFLRWPPILLTVLFLRLCYLFALPIYYANGAYDLPRTRWFRCVDGVCRLTEITPLPNMHKPVHVQYLVRIWFLFMRCLRNWWRFCLFVFFPLRPFSSIRYVFAGRLEEACLFLSRLVDTGAFQGDRLQKVHAMVVCVAFSGCLSEAWLFFFWIQLCFLVKQYRWGSN